MSEVEKPQDLFGIPANDKSKWWGREEEEDPQSLVVQPIFESFGNEASIVGHLVATQPWQSLLQDIVQDSNKLDIHSVIVDSCTNRSYTFWVDGATTVYLGKGDLHETKYDSLEKTSTLAAYTLDDNSEIEEADGTWDHCTVTLSIYPTSAMEKNFSSTAAVGYLLLVLFLCGIILMAFMTHDRAVNQRQEEMKRKTKQSNAVIASLFPAHIREKLFGEDGEVKTESARMVTGNAGAQKNLDSVLKSSRSVGSSVFGLDDDAFERNQIADLFPNGKLGETLIKTVLRAKLWPFSHRFLSPSLSLSLLCSYCAFC